MDILIEIDQQNRQRRKPTRRYFIMKRVESRPVGYRSMSGFPFNYLERLILWLLTTLERGVAAFVDKAIAPRLEKSRKRLDEILP